MVTSRFKPSLFFISSLIKSLDAGLRVSIDSKYFYQHYWAEFSFLCSAVKEVESAIYSALTGYELLEGLRDLAIAKKALISCIDTFITSQPLFGQESPSRQGELKRMLTAQARELLKIQQTIISSSDTSPQTLTAPIGLTAQEAEALSFKEKNDEEG